MELVSVVIPAYNSAAFIRETLDSVFAQTRRPDEIIVVDDASTDDSPEIIKALAAEAPAPLCLIELPRNTGGPATPMNAGIEAARGDLIALLDHDDLMLPEKLAAQGAVLDSHPNLEFVLGDYGLLVENHRPPRTGVFPWESSTRGGGKVGIPGLHILGPAVSRRVLMKGNALGFSCSNYFFRKSLWHRLHGFSCEAENSTRWPCT
ncbi:MAG: glycosyltransferase family A protein [Thermoguttaceae bacterium]